MAAQAAIDLLNPNRLSGTRSPSRMASVEPDCPGTKSPSASLIVEEAGTLKLRCRRTDTA